MYIHFNQQHQPLHHNTADHLNTQHYNRAPQHYPKAMSEVFGSVKFRRNSKIPHDSHPSIGPGVEAIEQQHLPSVDMNYTGEINQRHAEPPLPQPLRNSEITAISNAPNLFLKLPPELRNSVYEACLGGIRDLGSAHYWLHLDSEQIETWKHMKYKPSPREDTFIPQMLRPHLNLLHLSSAIRSEALPIFYNTYLEGVKLHLGQVGPASLRRMKALGASLALHNAEADVAFHFVSDSYYDSTLWQFMRDTLYYTAQQLHGRISKRIRCMPVVEHCHLRVSLRCTPPIVPGSKIRYASTRGSISRFVFDYEPYRLLMLGPVANIDWGDLELSSHFWSLYNAAIEARSAAVEADSEFEH